MTPREEANVRQTAQSIGRLKVLIKKMPIFFLFASNQYFEILGHTTI